MPELSESLPFVNIPQLLLEYKKFLAIKTISKDISDPILLSPSALVDQAWHAHLLHTAQYRVACSKLEMTKAFYMTVFQQVPPSKFWELKSTGLQDVIEIDSNNDHIEPRSEPIPFPKIQPREPPVRLDPALPNRPRPNPQFSPPISTKPSPTHLIKMTTTYKK